MAFIGPSKLLSIDDNLLLVCLGLGCLGSVSAFCFVSALPEAIEVLQQKYQIVEGLNPDLDGKLNDTISSFYTLSFNLSSLVAPIIGGALYDNLDYWRTVDINMIICVAMTFIFIIFNCGFNVFKRHI